MGSINSGRMIMGGLLAGLVINVGEFILNELILKEQWAVAMQAMNLAPPAGAAIGVFVLGGFVTGLVSLWLYAAVRPRLGPGAMTAVKVGLAVWVVGCLVAMMPPLMIGILPSGLVWTMILWCLFEMIIATVIGASIYKE